jgi:diguanylate cyclase (GGDEF)-like protein
MNDNFGHEIGDMLLVETAHNLKSVTGQEDELFRVGGDEFVLFLPRTDFEGMMEKLGTIRKLEKESRVTLIPADTSFGYAVIESMEDSIADKLSQAETVMYRDKTMRKQHE